MDAKVEAWLANINGDQASDVLSDEQGGLLHDGSVLEEHLIGPDATPSAARKSNWDEFKLFMWKTIWANINGTDDSDSDVTTNSAGERRPGILEWSLDHHICTLPFVSQLGKSYNTRYEENLQVLRNLLGCRSESMIGPVEASSPSDSSYSLRAAELLNLLNGHDDEAQAILVPETGRSCCSKGRCTCWRTSWHETARRCVLVTDGQQNGIAQTTFIDSAPMSFSRCPEYDQRIVGVSAVAREDYVYARGRGDDGPCPYAPLSHPLDKWLKLLMDEDQERGRADPHWDAYSGSDEFQQMYSALKHIWKMRAMIWEEEQTFFRTARFKPTNSRKRAMDSAMRTFRSRIEHYPLDGSVDGAVTTVVVDEGFCRILQAFISSNPDLRDDVLFFKGLDVDHQYHLPVLLIDHQDEGSVLHAATENIQRMRCTSAALFLATLGIMDFPVYGLSTYGSHGSLSQTWYSEEDKCCYAVDQVPCKYHFDIRERDGIIRYIAFLVQMKAHAEELRLRFESVRESIVTKLSTSEGQESLRWTLDAQVKTCSVELESMLTWIPFNWE